MLQPPYKSMLPQHHFLPAQGPLNPPLFTKQTPENRTTWKLYISNALGHLLGWYPCFCWNLSHRKSIYLLKTKEHHSVWTEFPFVPVLFSRFLELSSGMENTEGKFEGGSASVMNLLKPENYHSQQCSHHWFLILQGRNEDTYPSSAQIGGREQKLYGRTLTQEVIWYLGKWWCHGKSGATGRVDDRGATRELLFFSIGFCTIVSGHLPIVQ